MSILAIRTLGDSILRKKAAEIADVTGEWVKLGESMLETMYAKGGVGLAAPQVGRSARVIVADPGLAEGEGTRTPLILFNPMLSDLMGRDRAEEGCLSIPGVRAEVDRAKVLRLRALDREGKPVDREVEGYLARIVQHEVDHLNGVLFIDRLSAVQKALVSGKLRELERKSKKPRPEAVLTR